MRGEAVPVVDLAALFEDKERAEPTRFVALRAEGKNIALSVASVRGICDFTGHDFSALPSLLGEAGAHVAALGTVDASLLWVLDTTRLVPSEFWAPSS